MSCTDCAICYDAFEPSDGFVTLSCKHVFHILCATSWFAKQDKGTCPLCRKEMSEKGDLARMSVEDYEEDYEEDDEDDEDDEEEGDQEEDIAPSIYFSRDSLNILLLSLGGSGITPRMSSSMFHPSNEISSLFYGDDAYTELFLREFRRMCIGNGARSVATDEWYSLFDEQVAKAQAVAAQRVAAEILASGPAPSSPSQQPANIRSFSWHLLKDGNLVHKILNPEEYSGISIADAHRLPHRVAISRTEALWTAHDCTTTIQAAWRGFKTRSTIRA
jgi:hypothetical protein